MGIRRAGGYYTLWWLMVFAVVGAQAVRAEDSVIGRRPAYWYASAGNFKGEETTGQLEGAGSGYGLVVGFGVPQNRYVAVEGEVAVYSNKYNTPPLTAPFGGSIDTRMRVTSSGFVGNAKALYDFSRGAVYAGAGFGIFWSDLTISGTIFGLPASNTETDMAFGYQLIGGGEVAVGKASRLGVEYRRVFLNGNFGEFTAGDVSIGGRYVAVTYRQFFTF